MWGVLMMLGKSRSGLSAGSVDDVVCTWLEGLLDQPMLELPTDERTELQAMSYLSTDALWTIAREQMQPELQDSMSQLVDKNSTGAITENELRDLSDLVERGQRLTHGSRRR